MRSCARGDQRVDGAAATAERRSDLRVRKLVDVTQRRREALPRPELLERLTDGDPHREVVDRGIARVASRSQLGCITIQVQTIWEDRTRRRRILIGVARC